MSEATLQPVVGDKLPSLSREIDQDLMNEYTFTLGIGNPIHHDAEFAAKTEFGGPIASGPIALALVDDALAAVYQPRGCARGWSRSPFCDQSARATRSRPACGCARSRTPEANAFSGSRSAASTRTAPWCWLGPRGSGSLPKHTTGVRGRPARPAGWRPPSRRPVPGLGVAAAKVGKDDQVAEARQRMAGGQGSCCIMSMSAPAIRRAVRASISAGGTPTPGRAGIAGTSRSRPKC